MTILDNESQLPGNEAYEAFHRFAAGFEEPGSQFVLYTAIFGGVDAAPNAPPPSSGLEHLCFTDDTSLAGEGWRMVYVPHAVRDTRRLARMFKALPHRLFPNARRSIWMDGSAILQPNISELLKLDLGSTPILCFDHPHRSCAYEEVEACIKYRKDPADMLQHQAARYLAAGFPRSQGLYATGLVLRDHDSAELTRSMEAWAQELVHQSSRDQISLPFVAWREGLPIGRLRGSLERNSYVRWRAHKRWLYYDGAGKPIANGHLRALHAYNTAALWWRGFRKRMSSRAHRDDSN